jgi:hypothetical protein
MEVSFFFGKKTKEQGKSEDWSNLFLDLSG